MNEHSGRAENTEMPIAFAPIEPSRDLWPDIEAGIRPKRRFRLISGTIAAAFALVTTATLMTGPQTPQFAPTDLQRVAYLMQAQQRAELGVVTSAVQGSGVDKAMDGLLAAEREIHDAIDSGSNNPALLSMLARVHRRQLEIINQSMKV